MEAKQVKDLMEAYASVYAQPEEVIAESECECEDEKSEKETPEMNGKKKGKKEEEKKEEITEFRNVGLPGRGPLDRIVNFRNPPGPLGGPGRGPRFGNPPGPLGGPGRGPRFEEVEIIGEEPVQDYRDMKRAKENAAGMRGSELSHSTNSTGGGSAKQKPQKPEPRSREFSHGGSSQPRSREFAREEVETDLFDVILEYLVAEGYADTNKAALAIMANMSEEWKQSIVEGDALRNTIKTLEGKRDAMNANKPGSANTAAPGKQSVGAATYKAYQRLGGV